MGFAQSMKRSQFFCQIWIMISESRITYSNFNYMEAITTKLLVFTISGKKPHFVQKVVQNSFKIIVECAISFKKFKKNF